MFLQRAVRAGEGYRAEVVRMKVAPWVRMVRLPGGSKAGCRDVVGQRRTDRQTDLPERSVVFSGGGKRAGHGVEAEA